MPYHHYKYARRVDADTLNINMPDMTNALQVDTATLNTTKLLGQSATQKILTIYANQTDTRPRLQFTGLDAIIATLTNTLGFVIEDDDTIFKFYRDTDSVIDTYTNNKNIYLKPHGTGNVKFGTYTAGAATDSTGYITIKDAAGNNRKLMVQA